VRDPDGKLIALRVGASADSTSVFYPFTDNFDNVRAMVTATGTTPEVAYTYSAYGVTTSTTGSLNQPYRFGGGYTDSSTGLIKLGVRYYDPVHGRFTQHDPTNQEQHPYLYSKGCPSSYNDPSGASEGTDDAIASAICGVGGLTLGMIAPPAGIVFGIGCTIIGIGASLEG
jgi:RHS repeat-associated protein